MSKKVELMFKDRNDRFDAIILLRKNNIRHIVCDKHGDEYDGCIGFSLILIDGFRIIE